MYCTAERYNKIIRFNTIKLLSGLGTLNKFLYIKKYIISINGANALIGKNISTHWELFNSFTNPYWRLMFISSAIIFITKNILLLISLPVSLFSMDLIFIGANCRCWSPDQQPFCGSVFLYLPLPPPYKGGGRHSRTLRTL